MNTIIKVAQRGRQSGLPLVLVVLFLLIVGTPGCTFIGPTGLGCETIPITVAPGTCTPFPPPCMGEFVDEFPIINLSSSSEYTVISDEYVGFQFCAAEGAPSTSEPESVPYMIVAATGGRFGRGHFEVSVVGSLDVTVSDSPDPVTVGSDLTYTITLTNLRQQSVSYIEFTNELPGNVTFVSGLAPGCERHIGGFTCRDIVIAAGATVTYPFVVRPTHPGTILNQLILSDPYLVSPVRVENITIVNEAEGGDLAVTISDSPDPVVRGATLTYVVTVTNNGPTAATGVRLTDRLPPLEVFNVVVSQGSYTRTGPTVIICDFGTLASGASARLTVTGASFMLGPNINTATVTANEADPDIANNTASENTTVNAP